MPPSPTVPSPRVCRFRLAAAFALTAVAPAFATVPSQTMDAAGILQQLRSLQSVATVLYVAAHPDDENTRLIAYLALGRGYRTGYLSLTRGDGGQNLIGPEIGDALGAIRTHELLAARRIDEGEQFFSRATDFGFSKSTEETLRLWNHDQVLADVVRVIRMIRPDVIVTRFSPEPGGTHAHHTASAMLAVEAFKRAADPNAFPEQLAELEPWRAKRVLWNFFRWGASGTPEPDVLRLDVGGFDPLLGQSYGEIAARARTMHKSQGFGSVATRGAAWEQFRLLAGEAAAGDIMDGVDTSWGRIAGAGDLDAEIAGIIAAFNPLAPSESTPALLALRKHMAALPDEPIVRYKRSQLDRILRSTVGLHVETTLPEAEVTPGEALKLRSSVMIRAAVPVTWKATRVAGKKEIEVGAVLQTGEAASREIALQLAPDVPLTQPYWLRAPGTEGLHRVDDPALIGRPVNPPAVPIEHVLQIDGQTFVVADEPVQVIDDPVRGELRRSLEIVPPASLSFAEDLLLLPPGESRSVTVEVSTMRPGVEGVLDLRMPGGWKAAPASHAFRLETAGQRARFAFDLTAPAQPGSAMVQAVATVDGREFSHRRIEVAYDHIPRLLLQPPSQLEAVDLDLETRGRNIGYLPGAGDLVGECLARIGYAVTNLSGADLTPDRLAAFDAVVLGVRAFNTRNDLVPRLPSLFAYAEGGGTVVVQYNTTAELKTTTLAPFPLRLSRGRVTDESARVSFLAADHPVLNEPNKITAADFDGWVQERGLYFPDQWDEHFVPVLSMGDPGEPPLEGSLLVARHGRGWFVYSGLSWFRQLPAGVPGAYRLFANLVSLGN